MKPSQIVSTMFSAGVLFVGLSLLTAAVFLVMSTIQDIEESAESSIGLAQVLTEAQKRPVSDDLETPSHAPQGTEKWPWGDDSPSWSDAQANVDAYARWLDQNNPGHSVQVVTNGEVSAYTPGPESCGEFADGITATGADATNPGIAVPGEHLRYCRERDIIVVVPGYGQHIPDDTGGALNRSWEEDREFHVDIRYQDVQTCYEWGRKYGTLFLLIPTEEP